MSAKQNTLLEVARLSVKFSGRYMQPYSHTKSPHKFTQAQLMAGLILRAYLKTTYRGVMEVLQTSEALQTCLGFQRLPHYSTLKYFADRSDTLVLVDAILGEVVRQIVAQGGAADQAVAIDSTGVESTSASAYFNTRRGRKQKRYVKLSLCVTCGTLLPASVVLSWGPCNDKAVAAPLLDKTRAVVQPKMLFADAGTTPNGFIGIVAMIGRLPVGFRLRCIARMER